MKPIQGFDGYFVTEDGEVYSAHRHKWLKKSLSRFGYYRVTLYRQRKPKTVSVHRLVATAFLDNPSGDKVQVNHKNEIKTDNRAENLEWCTCSYNINYGSRNSIVSEKQKANKRSSVGRRVEQFDLTSGRVIRVWSALREIEEELGIPHGNIASVCNGRRKTRAGFGWRYAEVSK